MFMNQFTLRNYPKEALKDSKGLHEPVLFSLYDTEEIDTLSEKSSKPKKKKDNKRNQSKGSLEIELSDLKNDEAKLKINEGPDIIKTDKNNEFKKGSKRLTIGELIELEYFYLSLDKFDEINKNKYYSYQIRKHINLIRRQLEKEKHPINKIIIYFAEIYSIYINKCYDRDNINQENIEINKNQIIKDIQDFIDIIAIALKLFYMRSINYDYFANEKDEFINLICYILFNQKKFERSLFNYFQLSNKERQEQLNNKKKEFGDIKPKDLGIPLKFRLDEDTVKFKASKAADENKIESGIVKYFKQSDIDLDIKRANSITEEINEDLEMVSHFNKRRKMSLFAPGETNENNDSLKINKNDNVIYKLKGKKKERRKDTESVTSYKEFSEQYNKMNKTLREKYKEDINNPSELDIYTDNTEQSVYDPSNPYEKAIKYIETIKDYKTPLDKLTVIALVSALIKDCVDDCWKDVKNIQDNKFLSIDSDALLSIYLYIIWKMDTEIIYTHLDFIKYFTGTITKQSIIGYFCITVESSLEYIMSVNNKEDLAKN